MYNSTIKPFEKKVWLATPTMHGEELKYMTEAYETNWMSTVGANINEVERIAAEKAGMKYAVGLSCCTAALHLCVKSAGEKLYGKPAISHGALEGKRVFCSDMTFDATLNPVVYEGGIPVFIDTEAESWNMDPVALEKAFEMYPDVKLVVCAELYGFPGRVDRIKQICEKHGALLIEDAAEAMGATLNGKQCGSFGDYSAISYNGNKIITGSAGGCLLTNDIEVANKARKWSTQARENAELNGVSGTTTFQCADVFDLLPELEAKDEQFDVVILDPPAFTKSRSSVKNAIKGYREINIRGLRLVKDGGYFATCSCSHFMTPELFTKAIQEAARSAHRRLRQIEYRTQAADHPILWAGDETSYYLKFYIFQVVDEK